MSKFTTYLQLSKLGTNYARRMNQLSNRIFGEYIRPTRTMKVVKILSEKPIHLRKEVTEYYPRHNEIFYLMLKLREYGLYRDEHQDFQEEMIRLRTLRGKGPRKKGEGKRTLQKKSGE